MSAESFQPAAWPRLTPGSGEGAAGAPIGLGHQGARPALRLVGSETRAPSAAATAALAARRDAIERENRDATRLQDQDARAIVAAHTAAALEGGRAAVLRPESRRRVVSLATSLGLRPFDANLIIAIVQDGARRGIHSEDPETHAMLRLIENPRRTPTARERYLLITRIAAATILALLWAGAMVAWIVGLF